jgi:hypothetical protein
MVERMTDKRTVVGVPFYDGEGTEVLEACLENIDNCLGGLNIDAKIVVGINGPRASQQKPISYEISRSRYNADVNFIKTPPGIVNAEKAIGRYAAREGCRRIFLTDADISRLPMALANLWNEGDKPIVGSNYTTYPLEIMTGSGIELSPQEIAFMRIFEADKQPLAREFTYKYRPALRLKGSLLLVDTSIIGAMFGCQSITSDSQMNGFVPEKERQIVLDSAFLHFARVDITDHIQARLRHFRAAESVNNLDVFARKSLIYKPSTADEVARLILEKYPAATRVVSDFLLQCALRYKVAEICRTIARGRKYNPKLTKASFGEVNLEIDIRSFNEAARRIEDLMGLVNWEGLNAPVTKGNGTTHNGGHRAPINLEPFLASREHRQIILDNLGLDKDANV